MDNNIFDISWIHKKYFLGYVHNKENIGVDADLMFYSHEQRFLVKLRNKNNRIVTTIERVEEFKLTKKKLEYFFMNRSFYIPVEMVSRCYSDLSEEEAEKLYGYVHSSFPRPEGVHMQDTFIYDIEQEIAFPIYSESYSEYDDVNMLDVMSGCALLTEKFDGKYLSYPERMVKQIKGDIDEDNLLLSKYFKGKATVLLGVACKNSLSGDSQRVLDLYMKIDGDLYQYSYRCGLFDHGKGNYSFKQIASINDFEVSNDNKVMLYIANKKVNVQEHNAINTKVSKMRELWCDEIDKNDFSMTPYIVYVPEMYISSELFVVSLEKDNCEGRIKTSIMEKVSGSTGKVRAKRFIETLSYILKE